MFHRRVDEAWAEIEHHAGRLAGDVAVVTHGLVLRSLLERSVPQACSVRAADKRKTRSDSGGRSLYWVAVGEAY